MRITSTSLPNVCLRIAKIYVPSHQYRIESLINRMNFITERISAHRINFSHKCINCKSNTHQRTLSILKVSFQLLCTVSTLIERHREWRSIMTSLPCRVSRVPVSWIPHPLCIISVDAGEFIGYEESWRPYLKENSAGSGWIPERALGSYKWRPRCDIPRHRLLAPIGFWSFG